MRLIPKPGIQVVISCWGAGGGHWQCILGTQCCCNCLILPRAEGSIVKSFLADSKQGLQPRGAKSVTALIFLLYLHLCKKLSVRVEGTNNYIFALDTTLRIQVLSPY